MWEWVELVNIQGERLELIFQHILHKLRYFSLGLIPKDCSSTAWTSIDNSLELDRSIFSIIAI